MDICSQAIGHCAQAITFTLCVRVQVFTADQVDMLKSTVLIVSGWEKPNFVHIEHVRGGTVNAVLLGIFTLSFLRNMEA